jgi:predicted transcriptional regulator of viral defense system
MAHLRERYYYVALLSAAQFHGAAHQRPQQFQVMVAGNRKPIACGEVRVQFFARRDLERTPVLEVNTPRGPVRLSAPEATALEIVGYADRCGGLGNVATVLSELGETMDPAKLAAAARLSPVVWSQRLGYLLGLVGHAALASALEEHVAEHAAVTAPLVRARPITGAPRVTKWKLAINADVEPDL